MIYDTDFEFVDKKEPLAGIVKKYRKKAKLTVQQLARITGFRVKYIVAIEQGRHFPWKKTLEEIDTALNLEKGFIYKEWRRKKRQGKHGKS